MIKAKTLIIEANCPDEFQNLINQINDNHNVFATQTHITPITTPHSTKLIYTAILFIRYNTEIKK